jgi:CRISPR-associated endonuclease/helicase Cas3
MMNLIELLRAKSEREGEVGKNILLKNHVIETLERAKQLKKFIETNGDTISYDLLKDEKFFTALAVALILHDFGKINYDFQRRVHDKESDDWKQLREFLKPLRGINVRHEILSSIWASILLDDNSNSDWKDWLSRIRTAILLHHYNEYYIGEKDLMEIVQNYFEDIEKYIKFIIDNWQEFEKFLNDLLNGIYVKFADDDFIKNTIKIIRYNLNLERAKTLLEMIENREDDISEFAEFYTVDNENPDYNFLVFLGCLRRCDYSASGEVDLEKIDENIGTAIKLEDIYKSLDDSIKEKIGAKSIWQEELLKEVEPLKSIVLIAPTGSGKTEFALLWNAKNKRKLIYTLPLRVALNDLFWRFKNSYFGDVVDILHSTAFIEYLEEEQQGKKLNVEKQLTASRLLSSPILLTTPDQVFLTSLNYYGSDKVIAVYPLSSIVIDEIQTYDPEMASIIIKTLQIVQKLGGAVLVMTATLPPYFEPFFFEDKSKDYDIPVKLKFEEIDTRNYRDNVKNYNLKRHKIKVVEDWLIKYVKEDRGYSIVINEGKLDEHLKKYDGKNVFVVLNNVSKAIEVYKKLKDKYPNVFLLHSRLIEKEKDRRINEIKEKLNRNERVIVVATQIIEASVDLDFDAMITEISPIDSQIQRWGRVYRNRDNKDYDEEQPNIVIFVGESEDGKIKIDRGTRAIYDKRVVEKTIEVLKEFEGGTLSYDDERTMISEVFNKVVKVENPDIIKLIGDTATLKKLYVTEIKRNLEYLKYFTVEKKSQAQRLFRRIAGIQVVIPAIMRTNGDEIDKTFAKIVEDPESNKKTWKEIENEVNLNKLELKKRLYQYSINIPIFYLDDIMQLIKHEFKGFYVLKVSDEDARRLLEYGIEKGILRTLTKSEEDYLEDILL